MIARARFLVSICQFTNIILIFAGEMNIFGRIKERIIDFLIWLDTKLGGDSSTQSHAGNWENRDD